MFVLICSLFTLPSTAQDTEATAEPALVTCPTIVQTAVEITRARCDSAGLNQACYGHLVLDAEPRSGLTDFDFSNPGDIVDVIQLESLRLSAMDVSTGQWGVVLMEVEAETGNGEVQSASSGASILLFGDAVLSSAGSFIQVIANEHVNIRAEPSLESPVVASLFTGESTTATGRSTDGMWFRVRLPETQSGIGWVAAELVTAESDTQALEIIDETVQNIDEESTPGQFGPMQAFYFQSGVDDAPCPEAPESGLMIQTPEGIASITIWMDEVVIQLDATAFVQAQPGGDLSLSVIEGVATVSANGGTTTVVAGTRTTVALDDNLAAQGVPAAPEAFDPEDVEALPVTLLQEPVVIPDPLEVQPNVPITGGWQFEWLVDSLVCPDGSVIPFESTDIPGSVEAVADALLWAGTRYSLSTPSVYQATFTDAGGNLHQDTLQVINPDYMQGEKVIDLASRVCTLTVPFSLSLVSSEIP